MPAVAEVQFKATNSQTVVTAFNTIGTAATERRHKDSTIYSSSNNQSPAIYKQS